MKKFKIIATTVLASTLLLAGCGEHTHVDKDGNYLCDECGEALPGVKSISVMAFSQTVHVGDKVQLSVNVNSVNGAEKTVLWSSSNSEILVVNETGELQALKEGSATVTATSKFDSNKSATLDVVVSGPEIFAEFDLPNQVGAEEPVKLAAEITAKGPISNDVVWSAVYADGSEGVVVAEIEGDFYLYATKPGTVIVTVTSKDDSRAKASKQVEIIDKGFDFILYNAGYNYSKKYPSGDIANKFGVNLEDVFVPSTEINERGLYYYYNPATADYAACYEVVFNMNINDQSTWALCDQVDKEMINSGLFKQYIDYNESYQEVNCFMDKTQSYIIYSLVMPTDLGNYYYYQIYSADDIFYDATRTTNEDWSEDQKQTFADLFGDEIPFVALGENYDFIEYPGYLQVQICDGSKDFTILDGYADKLIEAGYVYNRAADSYFNKDNEIYVALGFTYNGNTIIVYKSDTVYTDVYPSNEVQDFINVAIGSEFTVPGLTKASDTQFVFNINSSYEEYASSEANITAETVTIAEFETYVALLQQEGFELIDSSTTTIDEVTHIVNATLSKGMINTKVSISGVIDFSSFPPSTDWSNPTFNQTIYYNGSFESPTVAIRDEDFGLRQGESWKLEIATFEVGDEPVVNFTSSNNDVATVDSDGVVSVHDFGEAIITASVEYESLTYSDTVKVYGYYGPNSEAVDLSTLPGVSADGFTLENGDVVSFAQGEGEQAPSFQDGVLTLFAGNTVHYEAAENHNIIKVLFNTSDGGTKLSDAVECSDCWAKDNYLWAYNEDWDEFNLDQTEYNFIIAEGQSFSFTGFLTCRDESYPYGSQHGDFESVVAEAEAYLYYDSSRGSVADGRIAFLVDSYYTIEDVTIDGELDSETLESILEWVWYDVPMFAFPTGTDESGYPVEEVTFDANGMAHKEFGTYDHDFLCDIHTENIEGEIYIVYEWFVPQN